MEEKVVQEVLRTGRLIGGNPKLNAALQLIEALTSRPDATTIAADVQILTSFGSKDAILDLILICAGFNIIDRVADALDFRLPSERELQIGAKLLNWFGYRPASGGVPWPWPSRRPPEPAVEAAVRRLLAGALSPSGALPLETRRRAFESLLLPDPLGAYLVKVRRHALEITDRDVEALRLVGYAEDQIFEATVCAALGAGFSRLQIGLDAAGFTWRPLLPDPYRAFSP